MHFGRQTKLKSRDMVAKSLSVSGVLAFLFICKKLNKSRVAGGVGVV